MKAKIINIGNSKAVRIPKPMLKQAKLGDNVLLEINSEGILVKPENKKRLARSGWDKQMKEAVKKSGKPENLMENISNDFDKTEWTW